MAEPLDVHLDKILRAAGSALRHYTMQKSLDDMRSALANAVADLADTPPTKADLAPGVMRCAKCKFKLIRQNLNVNVGTVTAGGSHSEPYPNGCGPLWPVTWKEEALEADKVADQLLARAVAAEERLARLTTLAEVATGPQPLLLKGIGKIAGDGWKDTTTIGEVVYAWNREKPEPYKAGQFPRLGNPIYSASTEQYNFTPCSEEEAISVIDRQLGEARRQASQLREQLGDAQATFTIKRIGDRALAEIRFMEKLSQEDVKSILGAMKDTSLGIPLGLVPVEPTPPGWIDALAERRRQIEVEHWTPQHDDEHDDGSLAAAAAAYALVDHPAVGTEAAERLWQAAGWDLSWFKPKERRRNRVRAIALLLAEVERDDRATAANSTKGGAA